MDIIGGGPITDDDGRQEELLRVPDNPFSPRQVIFDLIIVSLIAGAFWGTMTALASRSFTASISVGAVSALIVFIIVATFAGANRK